MRRTRPARLAFHFMAYGIISYLFFPAPAIYAQGRGHELAQRLQTLQTALDNVQSGQLPWRTVDKMMVDGLTSRAWTHLHDCEAAISGLEYTTAEQLLTSAAQEIDSAKTIVDEDRPVPQATLLLENKEDKYLDVMEKVMPQNLTGRKKRALIYSEYLLVQKMLGKIDAHSCVPTKPSTEGTSAINFLTTARGKLYSLEYQESRKMIYQVYLSAQDALTNCSFP